MEAMLRATVLQFNDMAAMPNQVVAYILDYDPIIMSWVAFVVVFQVQYGEISVHVHCHFYFQTICCCRQELLEPETSCRCLVLRSCTFVEEGPGLTIPDAREASRRERRSQFSCMSYISCIFFFFFIMNNII